MFGASNRYAGEGDNPILDQDLDDPDGYEEPDPGLLEEKNGEVAWPCPPDSPPESRPYSGAGSVRQERNAPQAVPYPAGPCRGLLAANNPKG